MTRLVTTLLAVTTLIFSSNRSNAVDDARLQAVEASVQIQESPPVIQLVWAKPEISPALYRIAKRPVGGNWSDVATLDGRSEEHTSELQSQSNLVCRLLLEKKNKNI